jgi:hypothetical protein
MVTAVMCCCLLAKGTEFWRICTFQPHTVSKLWINYDRTMTYESILCDFLLVFMSIYIRGEAAFFGLNKEYNLSNIHSFINGFTALY